MNKIPLQHHCDYDQELSTLENIKDYIQRKMDFLVGFDKYDEELFTLENIKDYVQSNIDIEMEKYCNMTERSKISWRDQ